MENRRHYSILLVNFNDVKVSTTVKLNEINFINFNGVKLNAEERRYVSNVAIEGG